MTNSGFKASVEGLASVTALVVTLFTTPWFTALTDEWAIGLLIYFYGSAYAYFMSWFWFLICGAAIFFVSRAVLSITLLAGSTSILMRFFPA